MGRKSTVQEYERRATYNMANLPVTRSDSVFTTFESELKQLVTVCIRIETLNNFSFLFLFNAFNVVLFLATGWTSS
jgi:hypothetical protein